MSFKDYIFTKAREKVKLAKSREERSIVFAESEDERILKAALELTREGLSSQVFLIGEEEKVWSNLKKIESSFSNIQVIDPRSFKNIDSYVEKYFSLRKAKGITLEEAREELKDPVSFAMMMVRERAAHSFVGGALKYTAEILSKAFKIVKAKEGYKVASSYMIMDGSHLKIKFGYNGILMFADCSVIPNPNPQELAHIAVQTADSWKELYDEEPRLAFLSFSTKGSASSSETLKVIEALEIAKSLDPSLMMDGELQLDAALVEEVASKKAPGSKVAGKSNILIFPNLEAANIGYKLVQRFAGLEAYGPFMQGLNRPLSDLSRGCSADDIVVTSALMVSKD